MYQVVLINNGIETVIHHSTADEQAPHLASMNLQMFENQSNIFKFIIYKHYSGYNDIVDLVTQIKIFDLQNGTIKYEGRILVSIENMDSEGKFYKDVTCESELAYLNDSLVGQWELHPLTLPEDSASYAEPNHTILTALTKIIDNHNSSVELYKQFTIGVVEISGEVYITTNRESSLDALIRNIIRDNGVVIRIRKEDGVRYLDILLDDPNISDTVIALSRNLKTFKKTPNYDTFCTKLLAIGADGLTFESINNGKNYVENVEAIEKFGSITKSFEWSYITSKDELLQKAQTKLTEVLNNTYVSVEVNALDLNYIGLMPEEFKISTKYLIENEVQNFSEVLKVVELDLDLLAVWNSRLTFSNKTTMASLNATDTKQQVIANRNETITNNGRITQKVIGINERLAAYKEETDLAIVTIKTDVTEAQEDMVALNQEVDGLGTTITNHTSNVNNPHSVTKTQVGLGNVDNTSDTNKPISSATQTALNSKINTSQKGVANGVAQLDNNGIIPSSQLPSYVDDVLEYTSNSLFPVTGESGKIYLNTTNNLSYRWTGSGYAEISPSIALGETSSTAYAGDKGKSTTDKTNGHIGNTNNPHNVTKAQVGLSNVPNVTTNNQTPTYTVVSTNTSLTSGEILTTAFGKIAKAISSLISHLADTVSHITSTERTNWNSASNNNHTHSNKTTLDNTTASYTTAEKTKLSGISTGANNYTLPVASTLIGGVKSGTDITVDTSGNVSVNDDSHNHIISNTDGLQTVLDGKVDDSQVLTNVPAGAKFTDTVYVHPTTHPPSIIVQDVSNRFVTDVEKSTWNGKATQATIDTSINTIRIGGRNLLLKSNIPIANAAYRLQRYNYGGQVALHDEVYTATIKFELGAGRTALSLFTGGGYISVVVFYNHDRNSEGIASKTFIMKYPAGRSPDDGFAYIDFYQAPSTGTTTSSIEWVKLVKGNKATEDWTPAPEDIDSAIALKAEQSDITSSIADIQIGCENLISRYNELPNMMVSPTGTFIAENGSSLMVDFIPVVAGEKLIFSQKFSGVGVNYFRYAFYQSDKTTMVRRTVMSTALFYDTVPTNSLWLRVSYCTTNTVKLEKGNKATGWIPSANDMAYKITNGITSLRPTPTHIGQVHFDTTLGKPIWCKTINPIAWVDSTGRNADATPGLYIN